MKDSAKVQLRLLAAQPHPTAGASSHPLRVHAPALEPGGTHGGSMGLCPAKWSHFAVFSPLPELQSSILQGSGCHPLLVLFLSNPWVSFPHSTFPILICPSHRAALSQQLYQHNYHTALMDMAENPPRWFHFRPQVPVEMLAPTGFPESHII